MILVPVWEAPIFLMIYKHYCHGSNKWQPQLEAIVLLNISNCIGYCCQNRREGVIQMEMNRKESIYTNSFSKSVSSKKKEQIIKYGEKLSLSEIPRFELKVLLLCWYFANIYFISTVSARKTHSIKHLRIWTESINIVSTAITLVFCPRKPASRKNSPFLLLSSYSSLQPLRVTHSEINGPFL